MFGVRPVEEVAPPHLIPRRSIAAKRLWTTEKRWATSRHSAIRSAFSSHASGFFCFSAAAFRALMSASITFFIVPIMSAPSGLISLAKKVSARVSVVIFTRVPSPAAVNVNTVLKCEPHVSASTA